MHSKSILTARQKPRRHSSSPHLVSCDALLHDAVAVCKDGVSAMAKLLPSRAGTEALKVGFIDSCLSQYHIKTVSSPYNILSNGFADTAEEPIQHMHERTSDTIFARMIRTHPHPSHTLSSSTLPLCTLPSSR